MSFHNETHVKKTRRARGCDWCSERIEKGAPSVSTAGIYEGDFYRGRYHPECSAAITRYYTVNKCWGEEMPDGPMNRGGIAEAGEPESESLPENDPALATRGLESAPENHAGDGQPSWLPAAPGPASSESPTD